MFLLAYEAHYEGQMVLGVYSTLDAAMVAMQRYTSDGEAFFYRDLVIRQMSVDAEPDLDAGVVVWEFPSEEA